MKPYYTLVVLFFLQINELYSQKEPKLILLNDSAEVALNLKTKSYIFGEVTSFNFPVLSYFFDSIEPIYYIKIQPIDMYGDHSENRLVLAYNIDEHKTIWQKYFNSKKSDYFFSKENFVLEKDKKIFSIDKLTGETQWETKGKIFQSFPDLNIGLTFDNNIINNNIKLHAIDISTGTNLWTVEDVKYIKDYDLKTYQKGDQFIFASKYLNGVNIKTGAFWASDEPLIKTCMANYGTNGFGVTGVALNFASGSPCIRASNIINDSTGFLFANFHKFLKYDYYGKLEWESFFQNGQHAGISYLIQHKNFYYVINSGFEYYNGNRQSSGFSFIAQYDTKGQLINSSKIDHYVIHYLLESDTLILISDINNVSKIDLNHLNSINILELDFKLKKLKPIDSNSIYLKDKNDTYHCIQPIDSVGYYLMNWDYSIIHFDKNFKPIDTILSNQYTTLVYRDSLYTFVTNAEKPSTFVLDSTMKPLFELNKVHKMYALGDRYYFQGVKNMYSLEKNIFYLKRND